MAVGGVNINDTNIVITLLGENSVSTDSKGTEIVVSLSPFIYFENGGGSTTIYASDVYWDATTMLDQKINNLETSINNLSGLSYVNLGIISTNTSYTITAQNILMYITVEYYLGNPNLSITLPNFTIRPTMVVTGKEFIDVYEPVGSDTIISFNLSGGSVKVKIYYKPI